VIDMALTFSRLRLFAAASAGAGAILLLAPQAIAQFYVPDPMQLPMSSYINTNYISNSNLDKGEDGPSRQSEPSSQRPSKAAPTTTASPLFTPVSAPFMPRQMAAALPSAQRQEAEKLYTTLLDSYGQIAQYYGVSRHDLSGSTAVLIIGSYEIHSGEEVSDDGVKAVIAQLRGGLGNSSLLANAGASEKQAYYEQSAIIGTMMASAFKELQAKPDPALQSQLQKAAKGYLETLLGVDADNVSIDEDGLSL
jgi:hypothetical protein